MNPRPPLGNSSPADEGSAAPAGDQPAGEAMSAVQGMQSTAPLSPRDVDYDELLSDEDADDEESTFVVDLDAAPEPVAPEAVAPPRAAFGTRKADLGVLALVCLALGGFVTWQVMLHL